MLANGFLQACFHRWGSTRWALWAPYLKERVQDIHIGTCLFEGCNPHTLGLLPNQEAFFIGYPTTNGLTTLPFLSKLSNEIFGMDAWFARGIAIYRTLPSGTTKWLRQQTIILLSVSCDANQWSNCIFPSPIPPHPHGENIWHPCIGRWRPERAFSLGQAEVKIVMIANLWSLM